MDYQEAINKANQQISERMKREIFERLSISPIDTMHKRDGSISAHEAIVSAVDEARRCRMYEKMEEASGLKKFYEEVYPQVQENLRMLVEYQKIGTLEEVRDAVEKQKWIPCSERLPEDGDERFYMCIVENHEEDLPMFLQYVEDCGFGSWHDIYDEHTLGFVDSEFRTNEELGYEEVVAWMPLPEPYRPNKCHGCFGAANNDCERCVDGNENY